MRKFIAISVAILGGSILSLGATPPAAGGAQQVPFSADLSVDVTFTNESGTTMDLIGTLMSTQLGRGSQTGTIEVVAPPNSGCEGGFRVDHFDTFVGANGKDTLDFAIENDACPIGPWLFRGFGTYVITGGTGRFAGATGAGEIHGVGDFAALHLEYSLTGTISVPGKN